VVAVDTAERDAALRLRDRLAGSVDWFKIGKQLFTAAGPRVVNEFAEVGRVFLDLKFHDIPATVAGAVAAAAGTGASLVNVHASGGRPMLRAAAGAAHNAGKEFGEGPLLAAVTVLTHLDEAAAREVLPGVRIADQVLRLARLASECGCHGVVCSARELSRLREALGEKLMTVVPGIRPGWASAKDDQRRIATPAGAARRGANFLVVGRAITRSPNPRTAALRIREEVDRARG